MHRTWLLLLACISNIALAQGTYQPPEDFLKETFSGKVPEPRVLWITKDLRAEVNQIMGHEPGALRIRYWSQDGRTAWVLDEVGKEQPITTGIVVHDNRIEKIKVLVFRESRGWEVRYPFFTDQFRGATLKTDRQLDKSIDGITGATLSVRALTKLARLALFLTQQAHLEQ